MIKNKIYNRIMLCSKKALIKKETSILLVSYGNYFKGIFISKQDLSDLIIIESILFNNVSL